MKRDKSVFEAIDKYYEDNYPDTIILDNLYICRVCENPQPRISRILKRILEPKDVIVFRNYYTRTQLHKMLLETQKNANYRKILTEKTILSFEKCINDEVVCRANSFQLIGSNGILKNFDSLCEIEPLIQSAHELVQLSYYNISIFNAKEPFEIAQCSWRLLESSERLLHFYSSYLIYYHESIESIFKRFSLSLLSNDNSVIAGLLTAIYSLSKHENSKFEILYNIKKYEEALLQSFKAIPQCMFKKLEKAIEKSKKNLKPKKS